MSTGMHSWLDKWLKFLRRPPEDRSLIVRAALLLLFTKFGIRWLGFQTWKQMAEKFSLSAYPPRELPADLQRKTAERVVRAVRSAEVHGPVKPNCLERSAILWLLLRREGVEADLHVGARKEGERLEAHAWVELSREVLYDGQEIHSDYARFDAPIAAHLGSQTRLKLVSNTASKTAAS